MGECGCVSNDEKYKFPGPGKSFYILTLSNACLNCCSPSGIAIEHIKPGTYLYKYYSDKDYYDGDLKFEKWYDSEGIGIKTGELRNEFVDRTKKHLIGINSKEFGEDGSIDEYGAEAILEEMYENTIVRPKLMNGV